MYIEIAKNKKDKELPQLKIKEQKVIEAVEEKVTLSCLIVEKTALQNNINKTKGEPAKYK